MNSKLKKKVILLVFLFVVFITLVVNFHKIRFALGMYNIYTQEKNTNVASENNESKEKNENSNPLKSIIENFDNGEKVKDEPIKNEPPIDNIETIDKWPDSNPIEETNTTKSYIDIIVEYNENFKALRTSFESDLEDLIDKGIDEYHDGQTSTANLVSKYLTDGTELEKISDKQFNSLVKEMEQELKTNNHDVKIIEEVKAYYTDFKNLKKQEVISKGMKKLK